MMDDWMIYDILEKCTRLARKSLRTWYRIRRDYNEKGKRMKTGGGGG